MMRLPLLLSGAAGAAAAGNTVLVFGDSWGDTGPTYKVIQDALKAHSVTGTVKSAAVGGTTACGWAKDPQALVKAAQDKFGSAGPDFVWYTAGGNDLIGDSTFHSCTKSATSLDAAQACYGAATDIANKCTSTMFDAYWKVFPNSKIMQCNYDIPCESALCSILDAGYFGNYCGRNVTCLNSMGVAFQSNMVGRLRQKYAQPQYTGLIIGGTVQAATGDKNASPPTDGKDGVPDLDKTGPCDQMVACVHPKYGSAAATGVGEVFYDQWLKKYVTADN